MRSNRRIVSPVAVGIISMSLAVVLPTPAQAAATAGATVSVEGTIEQLADAEPGADTALRLPNGDRLPVVDPGRATGGDRVRLTIPVPADVAADVAQGRAVDGTVVDRRELRRAASVPAHDSSELSQATVGNAVDEGEPVEVRDVQVLARAASTAATGVQDISVAVVVPKGVKVTTAEAKAIAGRVPAQVAGANAYWREQSGGAVGLRLKSVTGPYASAYSCRDNVFSMWTEAARATGFREGAGKHLVVVVPRSATTAGCSYGLATMGRSLTSGGVAYVADTAWPVLAHEIGHNLGLAHAKALSCRATTDARLAPLSGGCRVEEYGDPFDVMAASAQDAAGSVSVPQAVRTGLIGSDGYVDVTGTRTVTLQAVSTRAGVRGARIRDPRTGDVYWVEYRTRTGRDARLYADMAAGVRVLREEAATASDPWAASVALDATPTGRAGDRSWNLPSNTIFSSYGGGVGVSLRTVRGSTATLNITLASAGRAIPGAKAGRVASIGRTSKATPTAPAVSVSTKGVVSWKAAGAVRYDVVSRRSTGRGYGATKTWFARTTRTSAPLRASRGTTVQVRVRAMSRTGVSAWSGWRTVAFR